MGQPKVTHYGGDIGEPETPEEEARADEIIRVRAAEMKRLALAKMRERTVSEKFSKKFKAEG